MDGTVLDLRFDNFFWLEEVPSTTRVHGLEPDAALARLAPKLDFGARHARLVLASTTGPSNSGST